MNDISISDIIRSYACILSARKNLPEMRMEDALTDFAVVTLEKELEWLKYQYASSDEERIKRGVYLQAREKGESYDKGTEIANNFWD